MRIPFSKIKGQKIPIIGGEKKVMIALPVYDKPEVQTVISLINLTSVTKFPHVVTFRSSSLVHRARSFIADKALEQGFDYLLFIDGDMVFPAEGLDRLIDRDADVVGALCTMRQPPCLPTIGMFKKDPEGNVEKVQTILKYPDNALLEVDSIGMAFTLISRKALQAVKDTQPKGAGSFRFEPLPNGGELPEDSAFCYRAKQAGLKIHCDTGLSILHKGYKLWGEQDYLMYRDKLIKSNGELYSPEDEKLAK
jgi:hypothetical protein